MIQELKLCGEYFIFPQKEMSKSFFNFQVEGPSITIKIPPGLLIDIERITFILTSHLISYKIK